MTISDIQSLIGQSVQMYIQDAGLNPLGVLEHLEGNKFQVGNIPFQIEQVYLVHFPPHVKNGIIMIRAPKKSEREKIRAHVACDFVDSLGNRQFTFTPVNVENKSIAAIQLNGKGEVLGTSLTVPYIASMQGLVRLARVYLKRSIPFKVI